VITHLRREWGTEEGSADEFDRARRLLSRVYVAVADVEQSESAAVEADQLLRGLLATPEQSVQAWAQLIVLAQQTAILQTGLTATSVARHLAGSGLQVGPQLDFHPDIQKLRSFSSQVIERLGSYRSLVGDDGTAVRIDREFAADLVAAAETSLLITGDPGAGKSGALAELIESLDFADVVALSADSLADLTGGELRSEIGLEHTLREVLANWRSARPGYLVIDALDAGRGSRAQQTLMELMSAVVEQAGRWRIVATVRRFDLRYNPLLRELFPAAGADIPGRYKLPEFARVRHFNIEGFTNVELAQLEDRAPHLSENVRDAPNVLRNLLSNAFNLRLFAELIARGEPAEGAAPITSRLQLLDSYWDRRVRDSAGASYRREKLLRVMCENMIGRSALTVDGTTFANDTDAEALADLLNTGLVVEDISGPFRETRLLGFAHHVLFDYAVARLFLSGHDLRAVAASDPASLFLVRPSYQMYFESLWSAQQDRRDFWKLAMSINASADVPEIAKVIAPAVAAIQVAHDRDLLVFGEALDAGVEGAIGVLRHLSYALLADEAGHSVPACLAPVWARFTERISRELDVHRAVVVRNMVRELTAGEGAQNQIVANAVGFAARRLLRWTWANDRVDRFFTHIAISGVASTYLADRLDSVALMREIIEPEHLARYGYIEMPSLADTVPILQLNDPDLVHQMYVAAFDHDEESNAPTEITRGILSMSSNRRQDYHHSHYVLAEHFPHFLEAFPREAIEALCAVYRRYASRYSYRDDVEEIVWREARLIFVDDYLFDGHHHDVDEEAQMLDAFATWLRSAEVTPDVQAARFDVAVETLRSQVSSAGLWRALLRSIPNTLGLQIVAPLLCSPASLTSRGLWKPIGELIQTRFSDLNATQRLEIEEAIVHLDAAETRTQSIRAHLIGLIPETSLQTDAGRSLRQRAGEDGTAPEPPAASVAGDDDDFDPYGMFSANGIDPSVDANGALIRAAKPVNEFSDNHLNGVPTLEAAREIWPRVFELWCLLEDPIVKRDASAMLVRWSFGYVARAIDVVARCDVGGAFAKDEIDALVDVTASLMRKRADEPEDLDEFDQESIRAFELPVWVVQSAVALIAQGHADARLEAQVQAATVDESPSVRLSVAGLIGRLRKARPNFVEATLVRMAGEEQSGRVLTRLAFSIAGIDWDKPKQLVKRLRQLHERATTFGPRGDDAREGCSELAASLYIRTGSEPARTFLVDLIHGPTSSAADLKGIAGNFRNGFRAFGPERDAWRNRAFELAVHVVSDACARLAGARNDAVSENSHTECDQQQLNDLAHLIDSIGNDVYFSSGAYERTGEEAEPAPPPADYYSSARALLLALPEIPYPSLVHHVLQTLDYLMPVDPAQVFTDMTAVVLRGKQGGYEYDQMAASFITGAVSRFFVQHRHLLQTDPDIRTCLIQVLDTFVAVGWSDARSLTYQLDSVFR